MAFHDDYWAEDAKRRNAAEQERQRRLQERNAKKFSEYQRSQPGFGDGGKSGGSMCSFLIGLCLVITCWWGVGR